MKLLVAGTFSSGKTTLIGDLARKGAERFLVAPEGPRRVLNYAPNSILSTYDVRAYLFVNQLLVEWEAPNSTRDVLYEGGIVNNLAHDLALLDSPPERSAVLHSIGHTRYDYVFICDFEEIALEEDGRRFDSEALRRRLHEATIDVCHRLGYAPVFVLGSREERVAKVLAALTVGEPRQAAYAGSGEVDVVAEVRRGESAVDRAPCEDEEYVASLEA